MQNDPELQIQAKFLGSFTQDFAQVSSSLQEAAYQIKVRHISDYPIFVICQREQSIGKMLIARQDAHLGWHFYASFLEEFVQRQLIEGEGLEAFRAAYQNPDEFCCLFVVAPEFTNFVFIPYPVD